jgi:hypothetical protein
MDPVTMVYYSVICGCLGYGSPRVSPGILRVVLGVAVGMVAAALLPMLRRATGL